MVETNIGKESSWIVQFSVYLPNKVGCLHELVSILNDEKLSILGLSAIDHMEGVLLRLVVNYPDQARRVFEEYGIEYVTHELLGVGLHEPAQLQEVLNALTEAEINVFFIYSLMVRSQSGSVLVLSLEDNDFSCSALETRGFQVLKQHDLAR